MPAGSRKAAHIDDCLHVIFAQQPEQLLDCAGRMTDRVNQYHAGGNSVMRSMRSMRVLFRRFRSIDPAVVRSQECTTELTEENGEIIENYRIILLIPWKRSRSLKLIRRPRRQPLI